jgi:hypothetical protein
MKATRTVNLKITFINTRTLIIVIFKDFGMV